MNLQAQRDLSIAGDVVGRDKITINITRGLDELPTRYDSRVQNFLEYYLGAKDHPAPFGGRDSDLAALDAWLDDPAAPPYASLIAPAGRGKSALLGHWVTRLASRPVTGAEAVHVVYFPISIRFNTNLETVVFASLAARIAHVFGEKVTYTPDTSQYRGVFSDYLRRTPPNDGRVLVVLDGLDEAAGWEAGADLFPTVAPGHLRVIVAARPLALDKDETAWLNRLGWEMPNRAQRLSLAGLDREGVRNVLSQMGNPLDALATKIDLISRLYELSAGDPLLVRLYVEALLPQGAQAATLTPDDLAKLQPGLEAYFKRWFEEQQKLWGAAKPLQDKTVRVLLNLCAAALGPLKKDDVLALAPDIFEDSGLLDEAAQAVNRFIIGDGFNSGYVFSHPRLAEYFAAKLAERERQAWQARFLQYGRDTLTALENKTLLPKNAPAYVVQYYGAHLAQANAPATDYNALVCESWLRAWEWLEGTPAGFLNDAERAWQKAEADGPAALGQQIRAALCFASVASLSANISKDLLVACVKAEVISPALGLVMARQKPDPVDRANCLVAIAEFHPSEFHAIMSEALMSARAISDEWDRAEILRELAPRLSKSEQVMVLGEAYSAASNILDESNRARSLIALFPQLPEYEQEAVLSEAWSMARTSVYEPSRAYMLKALASQLPERLLTEALTVARSISDHWARAFALLALVPRLSRHEQARALNEAWSATHIISSEYDRGSVIEKLAPLLPESLLVEALLVAQTISEKYYCACALGALALRLPENKQTEVINEALSMARTISNQHDRAFVLGKLALQLPKQKQAEVLGEAWLATRTISDKAFRASALGALVPLLPEHEQAAVLSNVLSLARAISDKSDRARIFGELAFQLPEHERAAVLGEAWLTTRTISDGASRAGVLGALASRLPKHEQLAALGEALTVARTIPDESTRAVVLVGLARRLPEHEQVGVLSEVWSAARASSDGWFYNFGLPLIAPLLSERLISEAWSEARTISDQLSRTRVFGALASRLPEHERIVALSEACSAARAILAAGDRARELSELVPQLPEHDQATIVNEAWLAARTISDEEERAIVLNNLTLHLQEPLLKEALQMARALCRQDRIIPVLSKLVTRWSAVCRSTQKSEFEELSETLRAFARTERPQLLQTIQALLPVIAEQGGVPALRETARAIVDTAKWWP